MAFPVPVCASCTTRIGFGEVSLTFQIIDYNKYDRPVADTGKKSRKDGWQETLSFEETNSQMLESGILCDVTFLAGSTKQEVRAHKYMLASRNPVFLTQFTSDVPQKYPIEVPDIKADVLKELFKFIYTTQCKLEDDSAPGLLYAAKKYQIKELEQRCRGFLKDNISVKNVCRIFKETSGDFLDDNIEEECLKFINIHCLDVFETDGLFLLSKECLGKILVSDELSAPEVEVYRVCKRWAEEKIRQEHAVELEHTDTEINKEAMQLRQVLGDLVYLIRFTNIPKELFSSEVSKEHILTTEEKLEIFEYMAERPLETPHGFKFNTESRHGIGYKVIERFVYSNNQFFEMKKAHQHGIRFKISNGCVKLAGICVFRPCQLSGCLQGNITVLEGEQDFIVKDDICINYKSKKEYEEVLFERALRIKPGILYSVILTMGDCLTYFGSRSFSAEALSTGVNIDFYSFPNSTNNQTNIDKGQIYGLIVQVFE